MDNSIYKNLLQQADKLRRHNKQTSYTTRQRYFEAYKRFLRFAAEDYHLQKIANTAPKHVSAYVRYMQEKGLSASTIKTDLAAIRFWHDQIPNARYTLPDNSGINLARRQFGGVDKTWLQGEYNRMVALCWKLGRHDYAACIALAYHAGLRIHEVLRIDTAMARTALKTGTLTIKGKSGKIHEVAINRQVAIQFEELFAKTKPGRKLFVPPDKPTHRVKADLENFIAGKKDTRMWRPSAEFPLALVTTARM